LEGISRGEYVLRRMIKGGQKVNWTRSEFASSLKIKKNLLRLRSGGERGEESVKDEGCSEFRPQEKAIRGIQISGVRKPKERCQKKTRKPLEKNTTRRPASLLITGLLRAS